MGFKMLNFASLHLLSLSFCTISAHSAVTYHQNPPCHENESSALLQFKQSFSINRSVSIDATINASPVPIPVYPKTRSWNSSHGEAGGDCCRWDGVECDPLTGNVIALDLSASCLCGSFHPNSTLFRLLHLQSLDLSFNHFKYSPIPSELGRLSRLTRLNLSFSSFSGQIPPQMFELSKLVSLNFAGNPLLSLPPNPGLGGLARNLTDLKGLDLYQVNISSTIPASFANLSSLIVLSVEGCSLSGQFPPNMFHLPNIKSLNVRVNPNLAGVLPEFKRGSPLRKLGLSSTGFSGEIPKSIGNLHSLTLLEIQRCGFWGSIPESLSNLTQLTDLYISYNRFHDKTFPSWFGKLYQLQSLVITSNNFEGEIPASLSNLTRLSSLGFGSNQFTGQIPSWVGYLTHLEGLFIDNNYLEGPIPNSIFELVNLNFLDLHNNLLSGTVEFDEFIHLENLKILDLSYNKLSLHTNTLNPKFPNFTVVGLASCNLSAFPNFLRGQNELVALDLDGNNIGGLIPKWVWSMSAKTLLSLSLRNNSLMGFEQLPKYLPWKQLQVLILESNRLKGSLPIPSSALIMYQASQNSFSGNLSPMLCNLKSLQVLDVSENDLHGTIPDSFKSESQLRQINLRRNKFRGHMPRSLANCKVLGILDVGNNQISDTFPYWLGAIPKLHILVLQSNKFHGVIGNFDDGSTEGQNFPYWNAMKIPNPINSTYMSSSIQIDIFVTSLGVQISRSYETGYSMTVDNKGVELKYENILDIFKMIDLSNNKFEGWIPESVGNLRGLHLLNLSHNAIVGSIPSSLGNLMELESLDISHNKLWGHIPDSLAQLTFLAFLNVSDNNMSGSIPRGKQFDTFENDSYIGNSGLCGVPLSRKCTNPGNRPRTDAREEESVNGIEIVWMVACMGYVGGLVVGVIIGTTLTNRKLERFLHTFGRRLSEHKRENNGRSR